MPQTTELGGQPTRKVLTYIPPTSEALGRVLQAVTKLDAEAFAKATESLQSTGTLFGELLESEERSGALQPGSSQIDFVLSRQDLTPGDLTVPRKALIKIVLTAIPTATGEPESVSVHFQEASTA